MEILSDEYNLMRGLRQASSLPARYDILRPGEVATINGLAGLYLLMAGAIHNRAYLDGDNSVKPLPGVACTNKAYLVTQCEWGEINEAVYEASHAVVEEEYSFDHFVCYTTNKADLSRVPVGAAVFIAEPHLVDLASLKEIAIKRDAVIVVCIDDKHEGVYDLPADKHFNYLPDPDLRTGDILLRESYVTDVPA